MFLFRLFMVMNFYMQIFSLCAFIICKNDIKSVMIVAAITMTAHTISNIASLIWIGDENSSNNIYNSFIDGIFLVVILVGSIRELTRLTKSAS